MQNQLQRLSELQSYFKKDSSEIYQNQQRALAQLMILVLADNPDIQSFSVRFEQGSEGVFPIIGFSLIAPPMFFVAGAEVHDLRNKFDHFKQLSYQIFEANLVVKELMESYFDRYEITLPEGEFYRAHRAHCLDLLGQNSPNLDEAVTRFSSEKRTLIHSISI